MSLPTDLDIASSIALANQYGHSAAALAASISTSYAVIASGETMLTAGRSAGKLQAASPATGVILQPGTVDGQEFTAINEGANSITFDASGNTADGVSDSVPARRAAAFIFDTNTSLWYRK